MSIFKPIQEKQAKGKVKTIFNEIKKTRKIRKIPNFWKSIAHNPKLLERTWNNLKEKSNTCQEELGKDMHLLLLI